MRPLPRVIALLTVDDPGLAGEVGQVLREARIEAVEVTLRITVAEAERLLGVGKVTIYRWLRDGFITGEQLTAGAPWRIRINQAVRDRVVPKIPDGWVGLDEAANILGVARQTVLHKVQRGELQAVHVNRGQRKGLRIKVSSDQAGLFDQPS